MNPQPTYLVVLDTGAGHRPLWRLTETATLGTLPADLDAGGRPLPSEEARLVEWVTTALWRRVTLHPHAATTSQVTYRVEEQQ